MRFIALLYVRYFYYSRPSFDQLEPEIRYAGGFGVAGPYIVASPIPTKRCLAPESQLEEIPEGEPADRLCISSSRGDGGEIGSLMLWFHDFRIHLARVAGGMSAALAFGPAHLNPGGKSPLPDAAGEALRNGSDCKANQGVRTHTGGSRENKRVQ